MSDLASLALDQLVHQFAHPLDFLRELVQNALDAGSWRVVVRAVHEGDDPILVRISVEDDGEGMDEARIDGALTRLYATTKDGDLTRIGRFGIGFVSVFAVEPEAVRVVTGRGDESWEVWFYADRTFRKARLAHPVAGTAVSVFVRLPAGRVAGWIADCRSTLAYWCEHVEREVVWVEGEAGASGDDPFAIRAGPEEHPVGRPFRLEADVEVRHAVGGTEVVAGYTDPPRYGFYAGGLTLLATSDPAALGGWQALGIRSFKVRDRALSTTLSRDGVLPDAAFDRAMAVVAEAGEHALEALIARCEQDPDTRWHGWLAAEGRAREPGAWWAAIRRRPILRGATGAPVAPSELAARVRRHGRAFVARALAPESGARLARAGIPVACGGRETLALLSTFPGWRPEPLDRAFDLAVPVDTVDPAIARLVARAAEAAGTPEPRLGRPTLRRSDADDPVVLRGDPDGLVRRGGAPPLLERVFGRPTAWLDVDHPLVRALAARADAPEAAARALALALGP